MLFVADSSKNKKNLKTQIKKQKKLNTFFLFETFCRARAPATAPSRAKFVGPQDPRNARPDVSHLGSVPPRAPFPGPQNDVKKTSKIPQKEDKKEKKTHKKKHSKK